MMLSFYRKIDIVMAMDYQRVLINAVFLRKMHLLVIIIFPLIFMMILQDKQLDNKGINKLMATNNLTQVSALNNDSYVFQMLNQSHANDVLNLIAKQFSDQQPLVNAYHTFFGLSYQMKLQIETEAWGKFSPNFLTNQLSVGCFDKNTGELIGVSVAKDLAFVPEGFEDEYMNTFNFVSSAFQLEEQLASLVDEKYQPLLKKKGVVMDILAVAIKKQHMGKKLLHKMMLANELLGAAKGYQYSYVYATNFKTVVALNKLNYQKVSSVDAFGFEINGVKCFQQVEQANRFPSLLLKQLHHRQNAQI